MIASTGSDCVFTLTPRHHKLVRSRKTGCKLLRAEPLASVGASVGACFGVFPRRGFSVWRLFSGERVVVRRRLSYPRGGGGCGIYRFLGSFMSDERGAVAESWPSHHRRCRREGVFLPACRSSKKVEVKIALLCSANFSCCLLLDLKQTTTRVNT